jgi:hypothetical protein
MISAFICWQSLAFRYVVRVMLAIVEEVKQMDDDKADEEALSYAIETITKTGRARKATQKALESVEQARPSKKAVKSGRGGRGGCGGSGKV